MKNLFDELLSCASAPTMNEACNKIRNCDYMDIINNAFDQVFGEITKPVNESVDEKTVAVSTEDTPNSADENFHTPKLNDVPMVSTIKKMRRI